ncbi:MAG: hypothetical protein A2Y76_04200 [Planctomycetes bacterium RBG_13_60_9]|nr:MAG: hypothetical protein A2Y76_04200 [Planctomycetes bacterium RBG_13_60_9]
MMRNPTYQNRAGLACCGLIVLSLAGGGCQVIPDRGNGEPASERIVYGFSLAPRQRLGFSPAAIPSTEFRGIELGMHGYYFRPSEKNGMVYTCRGGHIDTTHLRIAADWTAYLAAESYRCLMRGEPGFSYKLLADRSRHRVRITYPGDWSSRTPAQRERIAREAALAMGPYLAYSMVTWHEILTWHGFRCVGVLPEFLSAFSWEDSFSNLLGTIVASKALRDTEHPYDEAMTIALERELRLLGVQPAAVARQASESVRGDWYTGRRGFFVDMRKRGLNVGCDTGVAIPVLVPGITQCADAAPARYPAPTLDVLSRWGLAVEVEIEPHEWEKNKILRIVYPDGKGRRIRPDAHFAPILRSIRRDAIARYGPASVGE